MSTEITQHKRSELNDDLLAKFLHELNIARRNLTLYPPEHPQLSHCSNKVLGLLDPLLASRESITFGIAPEALFFEHRWLNKENPTFKSFAVALSAVGIASICFKPGLTAKELIRCCQLLGRDRQTIEAHGGFELLLQQQQISRIELVPIDYSAFQSSQEQEKPDAAAKTGLWEDFLHGLLDDVLDSETGHCHLDPITIAEILNEKLANPDSVAELSEASVNNFVGRILHNNQDSSKDAGGQKLGTLLRHLTPHLQESFLTGTFQALDDTPAAAENVLTQLPIDVLQKTISTKTQQNLKISPRLIALMQQLTARSASDSTHRINSDSKPLEKDLVRARLDVLFKEEKHDLHMPSNYQAALKKTLNEDISSYLPEEDQQQLKEWFENQSVEAQCSAVILELLGDDRGLDDEASIQHNLVELSRYFLDTGNFSALHDIYQQWANFLYSDQSKANIFDERVLTSHTQLAFMQEVLDGIELWGEEQAEPILLYIASVGEAYTELVIEQLGLAQQLSQRSYWIKVLEALGTDARQLLLQALTDERWYLIRNLLTVLGKSPEPGILKAVHRLAGHPHPRVRQEVIRILCHCNPATATRMLLLELNSTDPEAQLCAIEIAHLSNAHEVLSCLHQRLRKDLHNDDDLEDKRQLLTTLSQIGHRDSLSLFRVLLQKKTLLGSRRQKQFQRDIIRSLAKWPGDSAQKLLQDIATSRKRDQASLANEILQQTGGSA